MTHERTPAQLREHYEIERALADRLRSASKEQRARLYGACYDELFRRVPHHPQLARKADAAAQREAVQARGDLVRHFLRRGDTFIEIGPGDCSLSISMCAIAGQVYAIDVSSEITSRIQPPDNFELLLSDGTSIPAAAEIGDVAFSYQLIEHLHPADVEEHLREVHRALRPGGVYICVTPSRLNGPHDMSRDFDDVATGFHLREYTNGELVELFTRAGFGTARPFVGARGHFVRLPLAPLLIAERALAALPGGLRRRLAAAPGVDRLLGVIIVAQKPPAGLAGKRTFRRLSSLQ